MTDHLQINHVLRPVSPPRVLEGVYTDDQHERILDVIRRHGPWPTITAHHFDTVDAHFRGYFGKNSVSYFPELDDCFYNSVFLDLARDYWNAGYAKPTHMLFNLCGPHHSGLSAHLDAVTFRGVRIENSPVWLQNVMGKSGLFTDYLVKMAQVITWWYQGEHGTFTYWPDGPLGAPQHLDHPLWNKGVVVQNESMFHRGDPVGRPDERDIDGLKHRSRLGYDADRGDWAITTDDEVIRRYRPDEMRLLVHWNAEVYADMDEVEKNMDHSADLTHDVVFDRLLVDMREKGVDVPEPADPLHDTEFIRALIATYTIAPTTDWLTPTAV